MPRKNDPTEEHRRELVDEVVQELVSELLVSLETRFGRRNNNDPSTSMVEGTLEDYAKEWLREAGAMTLTMADLSNTLCRFLPSPYAKRVHVSHTDPESIILELTEKIYWDIRQDFDEDDWIISLNQVNLVEPLFTDSLNVTALLRKDEVKKIAGAILNYVMWPYFPEPLAERTGNEHVVAFLQGEPLYGSENTRGELVKMKTQFDLA